jgi:hypothetical protein
MTQCCSSGESGSGNGVTSPICGPFGAGDAPANEDGFYTANRSPAHRRIKEKHHFRRPADGKRRAVGHRATDQACPMIG